MGKRISEAKKRSFFRYLGRGASIANARKAAGISDGGLKELRARDEAFEERVQRTIGRCTVKGENALYLAGTVPDSQGRRDTKALIEWLRNRAEQEWKDRRATEVTHDHFVHDQERIRERQAALGDEAKRVLQDVGRELVLHPPKPGERVN